MSKFAQRLIKKEKRLKTGSINLGKCGLTELPKELFDLVWLEELIISDIYHDIEQDETLSRIKSTGKKNVFLSTILPKDFSKLRELKVFYCQGYPTQLEDISALQHCHKLRLLSLPHNNIEDVSVVSQFPNLQILDLSYNKIKDIKSLNKLKHVRILNLNMNEIKDATSLTQLDKLEILLLRWNQLNHPLSQFNNLTKLRRLDVSHSSLHNMEEFTLFQLESLSLMCNKINDIRGLNNFVHLKTLNLRSNDIRNLLPLLPLLKKGLSISLDRYGSGDIKLHENKIIYPPIDILEKGSKEVVDYFENHTIKLEDNAAPSSSIDQDEVGGQTTN